MKVFIVVDHVCEADVNVAVFNTRAKAQKFVIENRDAIDPRGPRGHFRKYESLAVEEFELNQEPK
jgi:hypothetical protein